MTYDHRLTQAGRVWVFELKTLSQVSSRQPTWYVKIPKTQLHNYATSGEKIIYLLPAEPADRAKPWLRTCLSDPDPSGHCIACANPPRSSGVIHDRRWAGQSPLINGADPELRLQPWFNHWAWCVDARDLDAYVLAGSSHVKSRANSWRIDASDAILGALPQAARFCHVLGAIGADSDVEGGPLGDADHQDPEASDRGSDERSAIVRQFSGERAAGIPVSEDSHIAILAY